jgi:hypothetical protein
VFAQSVIDYAALGALLTGLRHGADTMLDAVSAVPTFAWWILVLAGISWWWQRMRKRPR